MAEDWIKTRTDLYRDPKVCRIAEILMRADGPLARHVMINTGLEMNVTSDVTRYVTVGVLVTLWGVTRLQGERNGDDLALRYANLKTLDSMANMPGIGEAMQAVGWAIETPEGVILPRFFEDNNSAPGIASKGKGAIRQQRYRERLKAAGEQEGDDGNSVTSDASRDVTESVTRDVTVTPREEKRREEKKEVTPSAPSEKISLNAGGEWIGIPEALSTKWAEAYPAVNVQAELAKASAWIIANPKNRKSNYARFLTNWLNRAQDNAKPARAMNGDSGYCNPNDKRYVN